MFAQELLSACSGIRNALLVGSVIWVASIRYFGVLD